MPIQQVRVTFPHSFSSPRVSSVLMFDNETQGYHYRPKKIGTTRSGFVVCQFEVPVACSPSLTHPIINGTRHSDKKHGGKGDLNGLWTLLAPFHPLELCCTYERTSCDRRHSQLCSFANIEEEAKVDEKNITSRSNPVPEHGVSSLHRERIVKGRETSLLCSSSVLHPSSTTHSLTHSFAYSLAKEPVERSSALMRMVVLVVVAIVATRDDVGGGALFIVFLRVVFAPLLQTNSISAVASLLSSFYCSDRLLHY